MVMAHRHYWRIVGAEVWSGDRFHLRYECYCGDAAEGAYGVSDIHRVPRVITKLVPGVEEHFVLASEKGAPPG